jgi:hypothetical protein
MTLMDLDLERTRAVATGRTTGDKGSGFGLVLLLWMGLTVLILAALWLTGFGTSELAGAVEQGVARAESFGVGEVGDDLIRKAVRSQRDTLPFWTVIALIGQFLGEPAALAVRALAVATAFSAVAALQGRPIGYDRALAECAVVQGFWVLGLACQAALMMALRRPEVETSAALFLAPGVQPAWLWLALRQLDAFAMVGWVALACGGLRRGQVGLVSAVSLCLGFWALEAAVRVGLGMVIGAAIRLSVLTG